MSVAGHDGGTYATVFLKPAEEKASDANLPRTIVLAYAAAHEVGHLLLGDQAHTPQGLMKATWDTNDFQAMAQNDFHFSPEQTRELTSRYGTAHQAEAGAGTRSCGSPLRAAPQPYCICVIQISVCTCGRLMRILSRATLRSERRWSAGGSAARRVVKMLIGERWAQRVFGHRIEPLGPNAKISITRGGEIQRVPIRRELRLIVTVSVRR